MAKRDRQPAPEFPIERGIPMPSGRKAPKNYPFDLLSVGDSFFVPAAGHDVRVCQQALAATCRNYGLRLGRKFVTRSDRENNGVRVWRTA